MTIAMKATDEDCRSWRTMHKIRPMQSTMPTKIAADIQGSGTRKPIGSKPQK
ncbi:hypothetical protein [Polynucleobacter rarus]|uniref:hypothetical protein n=1 Tax=Polynucleobacter rarus TaxID=556055 RepID=UPI00131ED7DF|nr:hypothetical protein [Polynucleobacter rarus]